MRILQKKIVESRLRIIVVHKNDFKIAYFVSNFC